MSTNQNVETCKKAYAAFAASDLETVMSYYDDDVEFVVPGNSTVSGTYRGKAEFLEALGKIAEKSFTTTPERYFADDDVVVVLAQDSFGGESAPAVEVVTFRDGKIIKEQNFGDTAMGERVYGTK